MFIDEKELQIKAGKGGDGVALFRREIYVPRGGPDGGDGGNGGDILGVGRNNLHAFSHLSHIENIKAEDGAIGGHRTSTGKSGNDYNLIVPLGTIIYVKNEAGKWQEEKEIRDEGEIYRLAKGGRGGWGNWHFRSSIRQAPDRFNPGQPGQERQIKLILKLIADIGLVGLTNAGKSTFLDSISQAHPKIADYPFTTLEPQLGVAKNGNRQLVIADLPGLIEGASKGKGLGDKFLRHLERTHFIIHCIDSTQTLTEIKHNYAIIRKEIISWNKILAEKPEIIALTKVELIPAENCHKKIELLKKISGKKVYAISSHTHYGINELLGSIK